MARFRVKKWLLPTLVVLAVPQATAFASIWEAWTQNQDPPFRVVALSRATAEGAEAHVHSDGWDAEVWSLDASNPGSTAAAVTRKSPWVYAVDRRGHIVAEGHGAHLPRIADTQTRRPMGKGGEPRYERHGFRFTAAFRRHSPSYVEERQRGRWSRAAVTPREQGDCGAMRRLQASREEAP